MVVRKDKILFRRMNSRLTKFASELAKKPQFSAIKENALSFASKIESFAQKATPVAKARIRKTGQITHDLADKAVGLSHRRNKTEIDETLKKNKESTNQSYVAKEKPEEPIYSSFKPKHASENTSYFSQTQPFEGIAEECLTCPELVSCAYRQNMTIQSKGSNQAPCHFTNEHS